MAYTTPQINALSQKNTSKGGGGVSESAEIQTQTKDYIFRLIFIKEVTNDFGRGFKKSDKMPLVFLYFMIPHY